MPKMDLGKVTELLDQGKNYSGIRAIIAKCEDQRVVNLQGFLLDENSTVRDLIEHIAAKSEYSEWELEEFCFAFVVSLVNGMVQVNVSTEDSTLTPGSVVIFIVN